MTSTDPRAIALGLEIRAEAAARRVSIMELCKAAGVTRSALYLYLDGTRDMPVTILMGLADVLGTPPHTLLDRAEDRARRTPGPI